jgi:hypothetical protein
MAASAATITSTTACVLIMLAVAVTVAFSPPHTTATPEEQELALYEGRVHEACTSNGEAIVEPRVSGSNVLYLYTAAAAQTPDARGLQCSINGEAYHLIDHDFRKN